MHFEPVTERTLTEIMENKHEILHTAMNISLKSQSIFLFCIERAIEREDMAEVKRVVQLAKTNVKNSLEWLDSPE